MIRAGDPPGKNARFMKKPRKQFHFSITAAGHACQVVSLSLLSRIIYARVWCAYTRGVKFDCTKRTIRGQCTWQPANATNKPGHCPSYLSCALYQIPRCISALLPEEPPILKFHSDRRKRGRRGANERIAEQAIYSNRWFIRAFKRSKFSAHLRPHLCPDSRRFRTWSSGHKIHCPF